MLAEQNGKSERTGKRLAKALSLFRKKVCSSAGMENATTCGKSSLENSTNNTFFRAVYAHVRKEFLDLPVVPVVPVVRLLRNSLGGVQKTKGIDLTLKDSVLSYNE